LQRFDKVFVSLHIEDLLVPDVIPMLAAIVDRDARWVALVKGELTQLREVVVRELVAVGVVEKVRDENERERATEKKMGEVMHQHNIKTHNGCRDAIILHRVHD
jgi:hypothetical protein